MNTTRDYTKTFMYLDIMSIVMLCVSLVLLSTIVLEGSFAPILLYTLMSAMSIVFITLFSRKDEIFFKIKLFVFFFSVYLSYTLINHYILLNFFPNKLPFNYFDEQTFYSFSDFGLPYISGEKNFFDIFSVFEINELALHVVFTSAITYFSTLIDGSNTIIVQKLLSPFFGGLFSIVLYSTIKYQFKDRIFALNATFTYALLSAVFMYSTPLLRDIDISLTYMIFIYLFLQKNSFINFILLFLISFITIYLRVESGIVLFGLILLYSYFYARKLQSRSIKLIFYILLIVSFSFVFLLMFNKIIGMVGHLDEVNTVRATSVASGGSIGVLLNKLPFPLSYVAKVFFGQLQPFPLFMAIDKPVYAISGIFWPFIFIMMLYAVIKKNIRVLIDTKVKYLLIVAIIILFLMSSEPITRRMMSVYPIIYITSLYVFLVIPANEIKRVFFYYIFGIISLYTFYFLIKL